MKKVTLFILAAGVLVFTTLPANAQTKTASQQVKKEGQKVEATKTVAAPGGPATPARPVAGTPRVQGGASKPGATAVTATPPVGVTATPVATTPDPTPQVAPQAPPVPLTCTWDVTDYDFGKNVIQGKPASATFTLTNAGKDPITITLVQPSCGCTSPKYTKEPVKPGEKGEVVLTFNAAISGYFSKSAQVVLNDGQRYSLAIKGEVQKVEQTPPTTPPVK